MSAITPEQSFKMRRERLDFSTLEVSPGKAYDQITVVTQAAINFQLQAFPELYPGLQKVDIVDDESGAELHVTLSASSVWLLTGSSTSQQVNYVINVGNDSGIPPLNTFSWWSGYGPNSKQNSVSANDWKITFLVDMSLNPATSPYDIPESIRKQILSPGDYRVLKLVFDFTTANIVTNSRSFVCPTVTETYGLTQLKNMWSDWIQDQANNTNGNNSILGYVMTTSPSGSTPPGEWGTAPTFPPTALRFQNIGYVDPNTGKPDQTGAPSPQGDNNMLVYLEMTQQRDWPSQGLLVPSVNWVIPPTANEPALDGIMVLGRSVFLEGWLLPQLRQLNSLTAERMLSAKWFWYHEPITFGFAFESTRGVGSGTSVDFSLETSSPLNNSSFNYFWNYTSEQEDSHQSDLVTHTAIGRTAVTNRVSIPWGLNSAGQCVVSLSGTTSVHLSTQIELIGSPETSDYAASWECSLIFSSVQDGRLNITQIPDTIIPTVTGSISNTISHKGFLDDVSRIIESRLRSLPISEIASACHLLLNGPWGFHFAGGDTFYMQGVEFNREGDLMIDLSYKS